MWNGGNVGDYNKDGVTDELDRLNYNDKELKVTRFQPWTKIIHPQYGEAEVGGWNPKFWSQNPPPEILETWIEREARFNLMLAGSLPKVAMGEPKITAQGDVYTIEVPLENQGFIPTALKQALLVPDRPGRHGVDDLPARDDVGGRRSAAGAGAAVDMEGGAPPWRAADAEEMRRRASGAAAPGCDGGQPGQPNTANDKVIIVEPENRTQLTIERIAGNEKKTAVFKVKLNGIAGTDCTLRYVSTRGGVLEKKVQHREVDRQRLRQDPRGLFPRALAAPTPHRRFLRGPSGRCRASQFQPSSPAGNGQSRRGPIPLRWENPMNGRKPPTITEDVTMSKVSNPLGALRRTLSRSRSLRRYLAATLGAVGAVTLSAALGAVLDAQDGASQPVDFTHNVLDAPAPVAGAVFGSGPAFHPGDAICSTPAQSTANVDTDCEKQGPQQRDVDRRQPDRRANNMIGGANDYQLAINPGGQVTESRPLAGACDLRRRAHAGPSTRSPSTRPTRRPATRRSHSTPPATRTTRRSASSSSARPVR